MTSNGIWDPYSDHFEKEEQRSIESRRRINISATSAWTTMNNKDPDMEKVLRIYSASSSKRGSDIKPSRLAKIWGIPLETARNTIQATTQLGLRSEIYPLVRRFRTKQAHL